MVFSRQDICNLKGNKSRKGRSRRPFACTDRGKHAVQVGVAQAFESARAHSGVRVALAAGALAAAGLLVYFGWRRLGGPQLLGGGLARRRAPHRMCKKAEVNALLCSATERQTCCWQLIDQGSSQCLNSCACMPARALEYKQVDVPSCPHRDACSVVACPTREPQ